MKYDAVALLIELKKHYSYEDIASMIGKSFACVYDWARGKRKISKGDYELLKSFIEKLQEKGVE